MLRLTDIKLPIDHPPEALKAAILKKLRLPAEALLDWRLSKPAHDPRDRDAIFYIYPVRVTVKHQSRAPGEVPPAPGVHCEFPAPAPPRLPYDRGHKPR